MEERFDVFLEAVLAACPRATKKERREIRRELADHLEDSALDMEERGYTREEARSRAVAAMGDPVEIGRQWNGQLSSLWLWVGRMCRVLLAVLLAVALLPAVMKLYGAETFSARTLAVYREVRRF